MVKIETKSKVSFNENDIVDKFLYFKTENKEYVMYYILRINSIEKVTDLETKCLTRQCHYLSVPKDDKIKCYLYNHINYIEISNDTDLYEMNIDEYLNTFKTFVNCEGKYPSELPTKLIQDI